MSDYSKIASESMKQLTEKVINADLASRKRKMMFLKSRSGAGLIWVPIFAYTLWALFSPNGPFQSVNRQAGDSLNIWRQFFGLNRIPMRQLFRPEVYNRDEALKLKGIASVTAKEVSKDEKLVFKPYVWN